MTISDTRLAALQVDEGAGGGLEDWTVEWRNALLVRVLGREPKPGAALYLGFEAVALQTPITLALRWDRAGDDGPARAWQSIEERARLVAEHAAQRDACRRPMPDIVCAGAVPLPEAAASTPPHHSARIVWEVFTGVWTPLTPTTAAPAPGEIADDTRSLTLDALVEMNLPASALPVAFGGVARALTYLRCRLVSGAFDAPPALLDVTANAVPVEQSTPLWQRFTIPAGVTPIGTLPAAGTMTHLQVAFDAAGIVQSLAFVPAAAGGPDVLVLSYDKVPGVAGHLTIDMVRVGEGSGLPAQTCVVGDRALATDAARRVYSHDGTMWQAWDIVPSFDPSGRRDWHCVVQPTQGLVTFGDGERGRVAPRHHAMLIAGHSTAGAAGAIAERTGLQTRSSAFNQLLLAGFPIPLNLLGAMTRLAWPASGGADAESVAHASGRAAAALHVHERLVELAAEVRTSTLDQIDGARVRHLPTPSKAVNLLDLERIALDVPGTSVARARAWAGVLAEHPCMSAPGAITVVIVPRMPVAQPQPSAGLRRVVQRYIERRRMVATVVRVVGPSYLPVSVSASVQTRRGASQATVMAAVVAALNAFLDPLSGGPDGLGWPFGRPVYRAEILQLIDGVPGVDHVTDLSLNSSSGTPLCGNVTLCPTALAAPGPHDIRVE